MPHNDNPLSELVRDSDRGVALPADFQSRVWRTIEARQRTSPTALATLWVHWFDQILSRPRLAWVTALLAVGIGAGSGQWQATMAKRDWAEQLQERYVASVDPYVALRSQKHP